jgi:small conductance mechanosensitive channel
MDWDSFLKDNAPLLQEWATRIVTVIVLFVVAWLVAGWARNALRRGLEKAKFDATLTVFFSNTLRWLILVAACIAMLGVFDVETTSFAAVLGAMGLAIGLAFQGSLSNVASGVMLLIFRPFKVGDVVRVSGQVGAVEAIDLLVTTMDTPDNRRLILPNSAIFGSVIENITFHPTRRVDISVGTDYGADLDKTREVLEKAAAAIPQTIAEPAPQIILLSLGDSSISWQVRVWSATSDYWAVLDRGTAVVKQHLDEADIGIPFPQIELHAAPTLQAIGK